MVLTKQTNLHFLLSEWIRIQQYRHTGNLHLTKALS